MNVLSLKTLQTALCTIALWSAVVCCARAETFLLQSGGQIQGDWTNKNETPLSHYEITLPNGGSITLAVNQVAKVLTPSKAELEYRKIHPMYPDTVKGHQRLAQWCLEQELLAERESHLERIIQLDPNHEEARQALGYRRVSGKWMTRDQEMASRGFKLYKGRYRTAQDIELIELEQKMRLVERQWQSDIKRWHKWLFTRKDMDARKAFSEIRSPAAVAPLAELLNDKEEPERVKKLVIEVLSRIPSVSARKALVRASLNGDTREIRLTCLDYLEKIQDPDIIVLYIGELKNKDNKIVNRAGLALARMESKDAVGPLIDALVTTHKFVIGTGKEGQISSSFSPGGGGGFSFGGSGPKVVQKPLPNSGVLSALRHLTGVNHDYDIQRWKYWYTSQKKLLTIDARRD